MNTPAVTHALQDLRLSITSGLMVITPFFAAFAAFAFVASLLIKG